MFLKYCGFTRKEDVDEAVKNDVDAIGLIFYTKSKRYISPETARDITVDVPDSILKVGVFVGETTQVINRIVREARLDRVQLFANEITSLREYDVPVIPVYRISNESDFDVLPEDGLYLLDAFSTQGAGGTGETFDWKLLSNKMKTRNAIIAGGVNEDNVHDLLEHAKPYGIDLSSGIEDSPGIKNHKKMKRFKSILEELNNE